MIKTKKIFTALFLALNIMPVQAMYLDDCEAMCESCVSVTWSSPRNDCSQTNLQLPGINKDKMRQEIIQKRQQLEDSGKTGAIRDAERDKIIKEYNNKFISKYCAQYTMRMPGTATNSTVATSQPTEKVEKQATTPVPTTTASPSTMDQLNAPGPNYFAAAESYADMSIKEAQKIKSSTENLQIGTSIVVNEKYLKTNNTVTLAGKAFLDWQSECKKLVEKAGGNVSKSFTTRDPDTNSGKTTYTCIIKECNKTDFEPSSDGTSCQKKDKGAKCKSLDARWDGVTCWCGTKKQSLEADATKCTVKQAKAETKAEKQYESDIDELIDAYNTVMKKFVSDCNAKGKTFKDGKCNE